MRDSNLSVINPKLCFEGCQECGAKCCASNLIYLTLYDFENVAQFFPIFFRIKDNNISIIFFFYNKINDTEIKKCIYLKDNLCSIYDARPYACKSFPFAYSMTNSMYTYSSECGYIKDTSSVQMTKDTVPFMQDNKINSVIVDNFVTQNFIYYAKEIQKDTEDFINFAVNNNLLVKFKDIYKDDKYVSFQPSYFDELYIFNKIKISVLNLKRKEMFETNSYMSYIKAQLYSLNNVDKMI